MANWKSIPKISIIVPVYNVEAYLEKCVESILNQTFTDYEVILINDGSTDRSGRICEEYAMKDDRIVVIHKDNGGLSSARNTGLAFAKGDFVGFVDSDDYIGSNMYKELYDLCVNHHCDIAVCKFGSDTENKSDHVNGEYQIIMNNQEAMEQLFRGVLFRFSVCNKLFRKQCFNGVQFPNGRIHEDLATTYKLFSKAKKVGFKNFIGYVYVKRIHSILNSQYNSRRLDSFLAWEEILKFINEEYPQLYGISIASFTYWCLDHLNYIFQQVEDKQEKINYINRIKKILLVYQEEIVRNKNLSFQYKIELLILISSVDFYLWFKSLKRLVKGR